MGTASSSGAGSVAAVMMSSSASSSLRSLSASVNPAQVVTTKASLFKYYKELYVQLGLYDQYKLQIYSYLVATAKDLD